MKRLAMALGLALLLAPVAGEASVGGDSCYYYHGNHYPYRYHGHYYHYRYHGHYYNHRYRCHAGYCYR